MPEETFEVHLCTPADRAEQAELFNACFKKRIDTSGLEWRYDANPHGAAISLMTRPVTPEPASGVCGYACSPRFATTLGEHGAPVGQTGDVMTHPQWRKRGLFSELDRRCMVEANERGWPLVFGLPNRRSAHIFIELGWERIGTVRPYAFVLRADAEARALRRTDGRLRSWMVPLARRRGALARRRLEAFAPELKTEPLERFPEEVGALSATVQKRFRWMVRRDAEYLNWRFRESPSGLHRVLAVRDAGGAFAGYAVVQMPRPGAGLGFLVDVLGRDDQAVSRAIAGGLALLDEGGASLVQATAVDGSWWAGWLGRAGFQAPRPENHLIVILHPHSADHPLVEAARDTAGWYFTDGDRDDETMG